MFPFHWSEDQSIFGISSSANHQIETPQNMMEIMDSNNYDTAAADPLRIMVRPVQAAAADNNEADKNTPLYKITAASNDEDNRVREDEDSRKQRRREVEKQRRQEMASLFGALRSLLPLQVIRGNKSISDHMNGAVNYIRHLQAEIGELEVKRDKLKKTSDPICLDSKYGSSSSNCSEPSSIVIFPWCDGVQIMIRKGSKEGVCPLSVVMKLLSQEGINVFSCSTSRIEDRTFYKIHCEVNSAASMDPIRLQQKLEALLH